MSLWAWLKRRSPGAPVRSGLRLAERFAHTLWLLPDRILQSILWSVKAFVLVFRLTVRSLKWSHRSMRLFDRSLLIETSLPPCGGAAYRSAKGLSVSIRKQTYSYIQDYGWNSRAAATPIIQASGISLAANAILCFLQRVSFDCIRQVQGWTSALTRSGVNIVPRSDHMASTTGKEKTWAPSGRILWYRASLVLKERYRRCRLPPAV